MPVVQPGFAMTLAVVDYRFGVILELNKIVNFGTPKLGKINTNRRTEAGLGSPRGQARQISRGSR